MAGVGAPGYKRFVELAITSQVCGHEYRYTIPAKRDGHAAWISRYAQRACVPCLSAAHQRAWEEKQQQMAADGWKYSQARLQFERVVNGQVEIERA
jgi:hypothetical protein